MWISHRKEIRKLTSASPSLQRIEELWVVCGLYTEISSYAMVGAWQREKQQNKLVEWKGFVDTVRIKSADFKNKILS